MVGSGVVGLLKAGVSTHRAIEKASRVATLPFRIGRGIYRTFRKH
jgi:hypothetical protein